MLAGGASFRYQNKISDFLLPTSPDGDMMGREVASQDHTMETPGLKLKRARERLKLTFREVERASQTIAAARGTDDFAIPLSRLADIENKGTLPTIHRLYTLSAIYRLDLDEVLRWYGVPREHFAADAARVGLGATHVIGFRPNASVEVPLGLDREVDLEQTTFLSHLVQRWGKLPLSLIGALDLGQYRYGFIGLEDWTMHPLLPPGSLVAIDENRRKIAAAGWTSELDRPIYFLEHREGYRCGWCSLADGRLTLQPHPASHRVPEAFDFPAGIEVIGQVVGVAMPLDGRWRKSARA
jgi:transcriptional regulator with XRE-family HTH domain